MSQKTVEVEGIGRVVLAKRRGTRNLRLSIKADGTIRVGMPPWVPYSAGIDFVNSRRTWIRQKLADFQPVFLADGQRIGKSFRLEFVTSIKTQQIRTRVAANIISVSSPYHPASGQVQTAAQRACERALRREAERLLTRRLSQLAAEYGFSYKGVRIKRLTSRWGSCSELGHINLSYFLIQLPWPLIDYVIVHELVHTVHLNHSRDFWQAVTAALPDADQSRREIKKFRPALIPA